MPSSHRPFSARCVAKPLHSHRHRPDLKPPAPSPSSARRHHSHPFAAGLLSSPHAASRTPSSHRLFSARCTAKPLPSHRCRPDLMPPAPSPSSSSSRAVAVASSTSSRTVENWEFGRLFSLKAQIDHKMNFIEQELHNAEVRIVLVITYDQWIQLKPEKNSLFSAWIKGAFHGGKKEMHESIHESLNSILSTAPMWDSLIRQSMNPDLKMSDLKKLEESLRSIESKGREKQQVSKSQQDEIKEFKAQLELKASLHCQSKKQILHISDRLKGSEETCATLQQKAAHTS